MESFENFWKNRKFRKIFKGSPLWKILEKNFAFENFMFFKARPTDKRIKKIEKVFL